MANYTKYIKIILIPAFFLLGQTEKCQASQATDCYEIFFNNCWDCGFLSIMYELLFPCSNQRVEKESLLSSTNSSLSSYDSTDQKNSIMPQPSRKKRKTLKLLIKEARDIRTALKELRKKDMFTLKHTLSKSQYNKIEKLYKTLFTDATTYSSYPSCKLIIVFDKETQSHKVIHKEFPFLTKQKLLTFKKTFQINLIKFKNYLEKKIKLKQLQDNVKILKTNQSNTKKHLEKFKEILIYDFEKKYQPFAEQKLQATFPEIYAYLTMEFFIKHDKEKKQHFIAYKRDEIVEKYFKNDKNILLFPQKLEAFSSRLLYYKIVFNKDVPKMYIQAQKNSLL